MRKDINRTGLNHQGGIVTVILLMLMLCPLFLSVPEWSWADSYSSVDISLHPVPSEGLSITGENSVQVQLRNGGDVLFRELTVNLVLPEGIVPLSGSSTKKLTFFDTGDRRTVDFPVIVKDTVETGSCPVTVQISGTGYNGESYSTSKTFYVPVNGAGMLKAGSLRIAGLRAPERAEAGETFAVSFTVDNPGVLDAKELRIAVTPPEGVYNVGQSVFSADIPKGTSSSYSTSFFVPEGSEQKVCPLKITVSPQAKPDQILAEQYGIVRLGAGPGKVKTPQLILERYDCGKGAVRAGGEFSLLLTLRNTSAMDLSNIKVSVKAENGTFVPAKGSSTLFISGIGAGEQKVESLRLTARPDAEEKAASLGISMSYENGKGETFAAEDSIAIPVTQNARLVVDEIVPPYEVYAGQMCSAEVAFYNMGKASLRNVTVNAEGDFDVMQSNRYYAGNMDSGKQDSYSFNIIPRQTGAMVGKLIFSYEESSGAMQTTEMPFSFEVMEMPVFEDPGIAPDEPAGPGMKNIAVFGAVIAAIAAAAIVLVKRHRRKKLEKELELDQDFQI